ncbi:type IV secretory system conjugative DNA transfer family protein [Pseudonocardia sp. 73-21]|uniref:type IV secretory system conjugative DNA transfer family protein n=1 Tax=Pseudonocardia sp. 73-21 TaxID=1895809 RepID=UPI00095C9AB0|nr:type IV secretory system conjugative DNA transfer family protein [Pseudonocardia sp. 73-21]OJY49488.1 MAG: hypothetical protein BGP03_25065 [Pseudonocardia sp. 73-21]
MNGSAVLVLALCTGVAWFAWRRGARLVAFGFGAFAVLPALTLWITTPTWVFVVLAVPAAVLFWHRRARTSATVARWGARSRRKSGVASTTDIFRVASGLAMRRRAGTVRPSLAPTSRWRSGPARAVDVAVLLCRAGLMTVWASVEDVVCIFGGPRTGKSQWLAGRILDAPGAVLVTSTRMDLYQLTAPLRVRRGPIYVFNPVGLAGLGSTITFDPLTGCTNPVTAAERAADMLAAGAMTGSAGEREFWETQARRVLTALLHAAALGAGMTMHDVQRWVADADEAKREVTSLLRKSGEEALREDARQFLTTNDRTRTSITSTIMPALGWLMHEAAAQAATGPRTGGAGFDVADLLDARATVYLLGAEETQTAPLVSALTGHIAREARRIAALRPGGRLDPPLTLALDEAALICPVPLHQWTADMGGRGVTIIGAFQSRAQVLDRYGPAKAEIILNNSAGVLVFGGTRSRDDLEYWSTLGGERDEPITTTDLHGRVASRTTRRVPVLAPAQIANLPAETVVAFRRGMPPVIGKVQMAYRRPDVRAHFVPEALDVRLRARRDAGRAWLARHVAAPIGAAVAWVLAWVAQFGRWLWAACEPVRARFRRRKVVVPVLRVVPDLPPAPPEADGDERRWQR